MTIEYEYVAPRIQHVDVGTQSMLQAGALTAVSATQTLGVETAVGNSQTRIQVVEAEVQAVPETCDVSTQITDGSEADEASEIDTSEGDDESDYWNEGWYKKTPPPKTTFTTVDDASLVNVIIFYFRG